MELDEIFERLEGMEEQELVGDLIEKSEEAVEIINNDLEIESHLRLLGERMLSLNKAIIDLGERAESLEEKMNGMNKVRAIIQKSVSEIDLTPLEMP